MILSAFIDFFGRIGFVSASKGNHAPDASAQAQASAQVDESRSQWIVLIMILAVLWGAIVLVGYDRKAAAGREAEGLAVSTGKGFSEYVGLHVLITDRMLINSRDKFAKSGSIPPHDVLTAEFGQMAPMLVQVAISDASGKIVASSLPLAPGLSIADRPHFLAFKNDPRDRLFVSEPVVGRVSKKMSLQLVRPVLGPAGEFNGVVVASIDPKRLQQYFDSVEAFHDKGSVLIVGRDDGIVRARFTQSEISWGQSMVRSAGWSRMSTQVSGLYHAPSVIDKVDRIVGFHQIGAYPLVVTVSYEEGGWPFAEMALSIALGLVFSLLKVSHTGHRVRRLREQAEVIARLKESREREMEANRMKSNFLASISHELRTPLNSILGFSELIRDMPDDPANERYAELIHTSGRHLLALLNMLLDTAKIEAGRMEVTQSEIAPAVLVSNLVDVHRGSAQAKHLSMSLQLASPLDANARISTDETKLTQVLNNVLNNAVKFTAEGGISVHASIEGRDLCIAVADTGSGIPPDQLPKIFDRFSTVRNAGVKAQAGTGLGLPLSRDLMNLLGGSIEVESNPGAGTRVLVRLYNVFAS